MQITPGSGTPVGGEITGPVTQPPEGVVPPPPVETAGQPDPTPEGGVSVEIQATPPPAEQSASAEAAALGQAREGINASEAPAPSLTAEGVVPSAATAGSAQAEVSALTDQQAVHDVLTSRDSATAATAMEGVVAENHLEPVPTGEEGSIAQVAQTDAATAELGPEPIPAPPEAATPVTPDTPDSLVASEQSVIPPVDPAEPSVQPAPSAPASPAPPTPLINTTGYPLPSVSEPPLSAAPPVVPPSLDTVSQAGAELNAATQSTEPAVSQEPRVRPEDRPAVQRILMSLDGDVDKLYRFLGFTRGSDDGETKTGEGRQ